MTLLEEVFSALAGNSVRVALLIIVFLTLRLILRKRVPASALFAVWVVLAMKLLVPGGIPSVWSPWNWVEGWGRTHMTDGSNRADGATPAVDVPQMAVSSSGIAGEPARVPMPGAIGSVVKTGAQIGWGRVAAWVWVAGLAGLLARRWIAVAVLNRRMERTAMPPDRRLATVVAQESGKMGLKRSLPVVVTTAVSAPALFGGLSPRLLFPVGLAERLSDEELRLVVLHELMHCRRRDLAAKALIEVAAVANWFNPLAWIAVGLSRLDCELACDEGVMRSARGDVRMNYGETLLKILRLEPDASRVTAALGILDYQQQLKRRIQMILSYKQSGAGRLCAGAALVAALAAISFTQEAELKAATPAPATPEAPKPDVAPPAPPTAAPTQRTGTIRNFYQNNGDGTFTQISPPAAPGTPSTPDEAQMQAELKAQLTALADQIALMRQQLQEKERQMTELSAKLSAGSIGTGGRLVLDLKDVPARYYVIDRALLDKLGVGSAESADVEAAKRAAAMAELDAQRAAAALARDQAALARGQQVRSLESSVRQIEDYVAKVEADRAALGRRGASSEELVRQLTDQKAALDRQKAALKVRMDQLKAAQGGVPPSEAPAP